MSAGEESATVRISGDNRATPPGPGVLRPFHFPAIEREPLDNGIPVLSAHTNGLPVVTLGLLLPAGGVNEAAEQAGLAALSSALLESGAGSLGAAEIADTLELLGVQLSVNTSWDVTEVELTGLTSQIEPALEVLADLVCRPTFPDAEVERLRGQHLAGILQRRAEPRGLANEMAAQWIFSDETPFSRALGGTTSSLSGLTRQDITTFHAARYTPFGATIVVAGDLSAERARELAAGAFGNWVGPVAEAARVKVAPRLRERRIVIVDRPGSVQSEIRVGQVGLARSTPDFFPVMVMNAILGGAFTSRLNLNLRERQGFTYGVSSGFAMRREPGPFLISTAVQTEVTAAALTEIWREVEGIRSGPVREEEVEDARNYLAGVFPLRLQTTEGVASRIAEVALHRLPDDYFESYRDRILEVDVASVERVAVQHLHPEEMVVVIVGDAARIRDSLESLDTGPVEVTSATELE
jgi:zinc protease